MPQPPRQVHGREQDALLAEREQQIEIVEREPAAHEHLGHVARLLVERDAEEVVDLGEPREVRGVLREGRAPVDDPAAEDARGVEVGVARLDAEAGEVAVDVEERRAVLRHRDHVHALDQAPQPLDGEGVIEQLGEHREPLLRARRARPARAEERQPRLREAVLGRQRVRLDLVHEQAVHLHPGERRARADAHALRAGDDLRGEIVVDDDLHLERRVLVGEAGLELDLELLGRQRRLSPVRPRAAPDAPREVLREVEVGRVVVERERARAAVQLEADLVEAPRADREQHLVRLAVAVRDRAQVREQPVVARELAVELVEGLEVRRRGRGVDLVRGLRLVLAAALEELPLGLARPLDAVEQARLRGDVVEAPRRSLEDRVSPRLSHGSALFAHRRRGEEAQNTRLPPPGGSDMFAP